MPCSVTRTRSTAPKEIRLLGTRQGVIFRPMLAALRSRRVEKLPDQVMLRGRILFLTEDAALVRRQLDGQDIDWQPATKLRDNISTDEITPAYICYYYDETLGDFPYLAEMRRRVSHHPRRGEARGLRRLGERPAPGQGLVAGAVSLRRDVRRDQAGGRAEHRAHLPGELSEPGRLDHHGLLHHRQGAARRDDPAERVHGGRRRDHPRHHRVRRAVQLQRGSTPGERR